MKPDADLHALHSALFGHGSTVLTRRHADRTLAIIQSTSSESKLSYLCLINRDAVSEGMFSLLGEEPKLGLVGTLYAPSGDAYSIRLPNFTGGPQEIADAVCALLDYNFDFPPGLAVSVIKRFT